MSDYTTHPSLLARLSDGTDPAAWREFHDRYGLLIRAVARRQGFQAADCDEVVQDVLTSLTRAMAGFRYDPAKGMFRAYLKTVTLRAIFARRRTERRPVAVDDAVIANASGDVMLSRTAAARSGV